MLHYTDLYKGDVTISVISTIFDTLSINNKYLFKIQTGTKRSKLLLTKSVTFSECNNNKQRKDNFTGV